MKLGEPDASASGILACVQGLEAFTTNFAGLRLRYSMVYNGGVV